VCLYDRYAYNIQIYYISTVLYQEMEEQVIMSIQYGKWRNTNDYAFKDPALNQAFH
jgi:hypothetical protein